MPFCRHQIKAKQSQEIKYKKIIHDALIPARKVKLPLSLSPSLPLYVCVCVKKSIDLKAEKKAIKVNAVLLGWVVTTSTFSICLCSARPHGATEQSYRSEEIEISPKEQGSSKLRPGQVKHTERMSWSP